MTKITLKALAGLLSLGVVEFEYVKKVDGSVRKAKGTLCKREVPSNIDVSNISVFKDTLRYYDLDVNDWRTVSGTDIAAKLTKKDTQSVLKAQSPMSVTGTVTPSELVDLLNTKIVKFKYQKPTGEVREVYGTTDPSRTPKVSKTTSVSTTGSIPYYNIIDETYKTIAAGSVIELIDTLDVPLKK